jgi:molybdate transport system substrate-binding protein
MLRFLKHGIGWTLAGLLAMNAVADAAEIKVLVAEAMKPAFPELVADFERTSGHKLVVSYATAGVIRDRILAGEPADVAVMPKVAFDKLASEGKIAAGTTTRVAQSLLAIAVKAGASKPDISTVEAFKRALLASKSIAYSDPAKGGAIGLQASRVIERLGLTDQLRSKTVVTPAGEFRELIASGQAELGFVFPVVIVNDSRIALVAPIPTELQNTSDLSFMAGIIAEAKEPTAAKALSVYLVSPAAARLLKEKGMEPG